MNILITGASGFIGSELSSFLTRNRHHVIRLVRKPKSGTDEVHWDPAAGFMDLEPLEGLDGVVHLAGENIAEGRWTPEKQRRIRESRISGNPVSGTISGTALRSPRGFSSAFLL